VPDAASAVGPNRGRPFAFCGLGFACFCARFIAHDLVGFGEGFPPEKVGVLVEQCADQVVTPTFPGLEFALGGGQSLELHSFEPVKKVWNWIQPRPDRGQKGPLPERCVLGLNPKTTEEADRGERLSPSPVVHFHHFRIQHRENFIVIAPELSSPRRTIRIRCEGLPGGRVVGSSRRPGLFTEVSIVRTAELEAFTEAYLKALQARVAELEAKVAALEAKLKPRIEAVRPIQEGATVTVLN
jgi:hypothetical protein